MSDTPKLSKSRFINGIQCLKSLYLTCYHPELQDEVTSYSDYILKTGTNVGLLAQRKFSRGVLIENDHTKHEEAEMTTKSALANPNIHHIFEAAFTFDDIKIRIDILRRATDGAFDIIEVKSSTKVKDYHVFDVAIQKYVLEGLGYKVEKNILMHINSEYVYKGGDYALDELFELTDLKGKIVEVSPQIPPMLENMRKILSRKGHVPEIEIGSHCKNPVQCAFYNHCRKTFDKNHISKLYRISNKALEKLRADKISTIQDIPESFKLSEVQQRIQRCLIEDKPFISPEVEFLLSDLEFPLYFMDFETSNPALPIFPKSEPWKHIPFQWSVHILDKNGNLTHKEYLPNHTKDPRTEFATSLIDAVGSKGSVVVYYDAFEKGILSKLVEFVEGDVAAKLLDINERVFDLYKLVFNHVYHPNFEGSFSIKKVLPALVPSLTYKGLAIADGATALIAYQKVLDKDTKDNEREEIRRQLLEYCKLDTLAMVEIYRVLLGQDDQNRKLDPEIVKMIAILARGLLQNGNSEQDILFKLRKRYEEFEIQAALEELRSQKPTQTQTTSIREGQKYFGWYEKPKDSPSSQWPSLKEHLMTKENAWTQPMIDSLDRSSTAVVSHLAPPMSDHPIKIKGLVLGYIQSGKTANFSTTIAKAVDEGYKLIIVLAGMHNNLRKQTEARLREELVSPLQGKTCTTLTDVDDKGDFKRRQPVSANSQLGRADGFVLVVLKKNSPVLRNFNRWLDDASQDVIRSCPTLIIDDESDQASINTNKPDQDATAINAHIRSLIDRFHVVSYVGYTATPFANVFIDSKIDDIYPTDFLVTLEKPETYYGPEELFGRNEVNGRESTEGLPVIRTIPEDEALSIRKIAKGGEGMTALPESLKTAIHHFLIGCGVRLQRGQWKEHMTMLVHISHLTGSHSIMYGLIEEYLEQLKISVDDNDTNFKIMLEAIWRDDFQETTEEIINSCDHSFDVVWKNLGKFLGSLELIMDNSNSNERLTFDRSERDGAPLWGIVVGGNTLSRGLTLEGLTISYFVRNSKAYDTLLQMGRWFGYRKNYVDVTRIFVPHELYQNFYELATIEQEVRDEVNLMAANEERPVDVALRIRKIPNMMITASNKSRATKDTYLSYSGTKIQTHQIIASNLDIIERNRHSVEQFVFSLAEAKKPTKSGFSDLDSCHLFLDVSVDAVMNFLDSYQIPQSNSKFNKKLVQDYISDEQNKGNLSKWSVSVMSLKNGKSITVGGLEVVPVNRNVKHEAIGDNAIIESTLRAVSTPGEELIDLEDQLPRSFCSTDKVMQSSNGTRLSDVRIRHNYRPVDRPLLLIYPLKSNIDISEVELTKLKKETKPSFPLKAPGQVFAISIVFPFSNKRTGQLIYLQNKTV